MYGKAIQTTLYVETSGVSMADTHQNRHQGNIEQGHHVQQFFGESTSEPGILSSRRQAVCAVQGVVDLGSTNLQDSTVGSCRTRSQPTTIAMRRRSDH
jgi:hypothetical protein